MDACRNFAFIRRLLWVQFRIIFDHFFIGVTGSVSMLHCKLIPSSRRATLRRNNNNNDNKLHNVLENIKSIKSFQNVLPFLVKFYGQCHSEAVVRCLTACITSFPVNTKPWSSLISCVLVVQTVHCAYCLLSACLELGQTWSVSQFHTVINLIRLLTRVFTLSKPLDFLKCALKLLPYLCPTTAKYIG